MIKMMTKWIALLLMCLGFIGNVFAAADESALGNRIENIENLDENFCLEELYLASNKIIKIDGVAHLKMLKVLELGFNKK